MGITLNPFEENLLNADPLLLFFFFFVQRRQSHNDMTPFSDASLPKKYFPPSSSPPHIKHFLKKAPFSCSSAFFPPTSVDWKSFQSPILQNSCEALLITPLISQCFTYHKVQQLNYCDSFLIKDYFSQIFCLIVWFLVYIFNFLFKPKLYR